MVPDTIGRSMLYSTVESPRSSSLGPMLADTLVLEAAFKPGPETSSSQPHHSRVRQTTYHAVVSVVLAMEL